MFSSSRMAALVAIGALTLSPLLMAPAFAGSDGGSPTGGTPGGPFVAAVKDPKGDVLNSQKAKVTKKTKRALDVRKVTYYEAPKRMKVYIKVVNLTRPTQGDHSYGSSFTYTNKLGKSKEIKFGMVLKSDGVSHGFILKNGSPVSNEPVRFEANYNEDTVSYSIPKSVFKPRSIDWAHTQAEIVRNGKLVADGTQAVRN